MEVVGKQRQALIKNYIYELKRLYGYLETVVDGEIKLILTLRHAHFLTWEQIADGIGGGLKAEDVRRMHEEIGYSAGIHKDASLVYKAFASVRTRLDNITLFHTDRGNEFKNKIIDEVLETFKIKRSLSMKGCPYDNVVAEATFKIFKTEFENNYRLDSLEQLKIMLADYVNWFNNFRIHSTLGYLSPKDYKLHNLKKIV